jgi:hypothetical protein
MDAAVNNREQLLHRVLVFNCVAQNILQPTGRSGFSSWLISKHDKT